MRTDELFVIFETIAGSHLYGTSRPESDTDRRGVGIPAFPYVFGGTKNFEQLEDRKNDRVIYSLLKFVKLAADCNPNIIELMFVDIKSAHVRRTSSWWEQLIEHREWFVSKKCKHTFGGYAHAQLKKIQNHKKWIDDPPAKPDRKALGLSLESRIPENQLTALSVVPKSVIGDELTAQVRKEIEYARGKREWDNYHDWMEHRNKERYALETAHGYDTKNALHLVRLMRMGTELLTTGELHVDRRDVDADELLAIRNGAWSYEQLLEYAEIMDESMQTLYDSPDDMLPNKPNRKAINTLVLDLLAKFFNIDLDAANDAVRRHLLTDVGGKYE